MLRRSTNSTGTTLTAYAFGLEEHLYSGTGTNQANTYYYFLGNQLIGDLDGTGTYFLLTDALGSVLSDLSWSAGGASIQGTQVFGPYGNARAIQGTINTAKGFTGQYNDALTGLDYYNTRYYDPVAGVFLSADTVQGNWMGMNPYGYVDGNPETSTDPTGEFIPTDTYAPSAPVTAPTSTSPVAGPLVECALLCGTAILGVGFLFATSILIMTAPQQQPSQPGPNAPQPQPAPTPTPSSTGCCALSLTPQNQISGIPLSFQPHSSPPQTQAGSGGQGALPPITPAAAASPEPCSFTPDTPVTTDRGEQAIGNLHTGEKVLAYNPKTHKMELQPILHVWTHTDHDLVDLTITTTRPAQHGKPATRTREVVHTNKEHPFFTREHGFLPVAKVTLGMHLLRADGSVGVVTGWKIVPGVKVMYNLEVAQDHTFTVGAEQWVVHNKCTPGPEQSRNDVPKTVQELAQMTDELRADSETVRGSGSPNFAAINIASSETGSISEVFKSERAENGGNPFYDAEQRAVYGGAIDTLDEYVTRGIQTKYDVTLVTQYWPCSFCQDSIDANSWLEDLQVAGNGNVNLEIWHYTDWGTFRQILPGTP